MEKHLPRSQGQTKEKHSFLRAVAERLRRPLMRVRGVSDALWELIAEEADPKTHASARHFWTSLCFFGCALVCAVASTAQFPLSAYPVPFALVCAASAQGGLEKERRAYAFLCAGVLFGALFSCLFLPRAFLVFAVLILCLSVRAAVTGMKFNDPVFFRVALSFGGSLLSALFSLIFEPGAFSVAGALAQSLLSPVLCASLCGIWVYFGSRSGSLEEKEPERALGLLHPERRLYLSFAAAVFAACFFYAVRRSLLFGFSIAPVLATLLTLAVTRRFGAFDGAVFAALTGLASAGSYGAVALVFCALAAGLLYAPLSAFALISSFLVSGGYLLYFAPTPVFADLCADLLFGHLLFLPVSYLIRRSAKQRDRRLWRTNLRAEGQMQKKLAALSRAFSSLSEVFYVASDKTLTPSGQLASELIREATGRVCARCRFSTDCWEHNYGLTQNALKDLSIRLSEKRAIAPEDMEPYFRERCGKAEELCREINRRYDLKCGKTLSPELPSSMLCGEYESVARLLMGAAEEMKDNERINSRATSDAEDCLKSLKIPYRSVCVTGGRCAKVEISGLPLQRMSLSTDKLLDALYDSTGMRFDSPSFLPPLYDSTLILRRKRAVSLSAARAVRAKEGGSISGDTTGFFESERAYFYSLICDGMGSGREAAFTSRLASIFIEKLMTLSEEKNVTLEMLNRFLLSQKEERFSTVDLLEVDFYTGKAKFIKAGAAPSYVKRGTGLYRVESKTPPAGILNTLTAQETTLSLHSGDQVIMFSDGVTPPEEDDSWFAQTLAFASQKEPYALARYLLDEARMHRGGRAPDDMSVTVLNVKSA